MDVRTLEMDTWEGESRGPGPGEEEDAGESLRMISTSRDRLKGRFKLGGKPESMLDELPPLPPLLDLLLELPDPLPPPVLVRVVPDTGHGGKLAHRRFTVTVNSYGSLTCLTIAVRATFSLMVTTTAALHIHSYSHRRNINFHMAIIVITRYATS